MSKPFKGYIKKEINMGMATVEPERDSKNVAIESGLKSINTGINNLELTILEIESGNRDVTGQDKPEEINRSIADLIAQLPKNCMVLRERLDVINVRLREMML